MKKEWYKSVSCFLSIVFIISVFMISSQALTPDGTGQHTLSSRHNNDYDTLWRPGFSIIDTLDGMRAWCLEPEIVLATKYYRTYDYPQIWKDVFNEGSRLQITSEQENMMGLIAYYGYYATEKTDFDSILTQSTLWYYLNSPTYQKNSILRKTSDASITYLDEMLAILSLARNHTTNRPFDGTSLELNRSQTTTLYDASGTLHYFDINYEGNIEVERISNHELKITTHDDFVQATIQLTNDANPKDEKSAFWLSNLTNPSTSYQAMVSPYYQGDDVISTISLSLPQYTLTLEPQGGTMNNTSVPLIYLSSQNNDLSHDLPKKTGYQFTGWYTLEGKCIYDASGLTSNDGFYWKDGINQYPGNYTLYAHYTPITYQVAFHENTGEGIMEKQIFIYDQEDTLHENEFHKTGYTFVYWEDGFNTIYEDQASIFNLTTIQDKVIHLYAIWKPIGYTIIFDGNGGIGSMKDQHFTYDKAQNLYENTYQKEGYQFMGWSDGNGNFYEDQQEIFNLSTSPTTITLKAIWEPITYLIRFNTNGGSGHMEMQEMIYDKEAQLFKNTFTKSNYAFLGWAESTNGELVYCDEASVKNLTTIQDTIIDLFALWQSSGHTIIYDVNGGSGIFMDQYKTYGVDLTLHSHKPTYSHHQFLGWNTKKDGSGTTYQPGDLYRHDQNGGTVILYAMWESDFEIDLSFDHLKVDEGNEIPPFISDDMVILQQFDTFTPIWYVDALCNIDGDIDEEVFILESDVDIVDEKMNTTIPGIYHVTYRVEHLGKAKDLTVTFLVNQPPVIQCHNYTLYTHTYYPLNYILEHVSITDYEDGNIAIEKADLYYVSDDHILTDAYADDELYSEDITKKVTLCIEVTDRYLAHSMNLLEITYQSSNSFSQFIEEAKYRFIKEEYKETLVAPINTDTIFNILMNQIPTTTHYYGYSDIIDFKALNIIPSSSANEKWRD